MFRNEIFYRIKKLTFIQDVIQKTRCEPLLRINKKGQKEIFLKD